jgi:hypothetical protein
MLRARASAGCAFYVQVKFAKCGIHSDSSRQADLNEVVLAFGFAPQTLRVW